MKKDHLEVLLDKVYDELKAVHEEVSGIRDKVNDLPTRDEFNDLKREVQAGRLAVTDLSRDYEVHRNNERIHFMPSADYRRGAA